MAESLDRNHQSTTKQQQVHGNPSSGASKSVKRRARRAKPSESDPKIKNCVYVSWKKASKVITKHDIKTLMKGCDNGMQDIAVYHARNKYYGKVVFKDNEKAKAAVAATISKVDCDVRYWRESNDMGQKIEVPPSMKKPTKKEESPSSSMKNPTKEKDRPSQKKKTDLHRP